MRWIRPALLIAITGSGCDTGTREQRTPTESLIATPQPVARAGTERVPKRGRGPNAMRAQTYDVVTRQPPRSLDVVEPGQLCVTRGKLGDNRVDVPTFRATAQQHGGDAASMKVVVHGATAKTRALASGQERRQLGLKLRAQDGCNLVYVMWRLDPKPKLEVSVKRNPGARTAADCGAHGYTKVKPYRSERVLPVLDDGTEHELRAEISGETLIAWIDDRVVWQGTLPDSAHDLSGPAGVRSDNLAFDLTALSVQPATIAIVDDGTAKPVVKCNVDESD